MASDTVVIRLLLRLAPYADQREAFHPFNALVEPDEAMRADTVSLVQRAAANKKRILPAGEQQGGRVVAADGDGTRAAPG